MEINNSYVEQILNKILIQTENGKIEIGDDEFGKWTYYVELLTSDSKKENNGEIAFKIQNKAQFIENLKEYLIIAKHFYEKEKFYFDLNDEGFHEKLILNLFINATNFDLNNMESYVKQRTNMLKDENLVCDKIVVGKYLDADIIIEIIKNMSNLEGPYKFNILFDNNLDSFYLPSITFGKIKKELFVYCLQGEKEKQTNRLAKNLDRHFRKANKDVDMEDEILSQVSVSALIALTIFLAFEKNQGINKINAYNFMPVRYNSNLTAGKLRAKDEEQKQIFEEWQDRNQFNISNKFFNTLIRYAHHFDLNFDYDDICEKLEMKLKDNKKKTGNIIYDIENAVLQNNEIDKTL